MDLGIIFIDVNALKYVNDNFGHESGDKLLNLVSRAIMETIRENDFAARVGGDEFLVLVAGTQMINLETVIKRIKVKIKEYSLHEIFPIHASMGAVLVDTELKKEGIDNVLSKADAIMMEDKKLFYSQGGVKKK